MSVSNIPSQAELMKTFAQFTNKERMDRTFAPKKEEKSPQK